MKVYMGAQGKDYIKEAIIKIIEESTLDAKDLIYFGIEKKSDYELLIDQYYQQFGILLPEMES